MSEEQAPYPSGGLCGRCQEAPRAPGQRWCKPCRADYERERRARSTPPTVERPSQVEHSTPLAPRRRSGRVAPRVIPAVTEDGLRLRLTPAGLRRAARRHRRLTLATTTRGVSLLVTSTELRRGRAAERALSAGPT